MSFVTSTSELHIHLRVLTFLKTTYPTKKSHCDSSSLNIMTWGLQIFSVFQTILAM